MIARPWHDTARALKAQGVRVTDIADRIGVSSVTIYRVLDPEYAARQRAATNAANNRRYAEDPIFRAERKQESGRSGRFQGRCR